MKNKFSLLKAGEVAAFGERWKFAVGGWSGRCPFSSQSDTFKLAIYKRRRRVSAKININCYTTEHRSAFWWGLAHTAAFLPHYTLYYLLASDAAPKTHTAHTFPWCALSRPGFALCKRQFAFSCSFSATASTEFRRVVISSRQNNTLPGIACFRWEKRGKKVSKAKYQNKCVHLQNKQVREKERPLELNWMEIEGESILVWTVEYTNAALRYIK